MLTGSDSRTGVDIGELLRSNSVSRFASGHSLCSLLVRGFKWAYVADLRSKGNYTSRLAAL